MYGGCVVTWIILIDFNPIKLLQSLLGGQYAGVSSLAEIKSYLNSLAGEVVKVYVAVLMLWFWWVVSFEFSVFKYALSRCHPDIVVYDYGI